MNEPQAILQFPGFRSPNYTMVPDELFDELMAGLSGAEIKVLLYIIRRTFGFKKQSDDISLNQICQGIRTKNGRILDHGTGLSRSTVKVALQALSSKSVIVAAHRASAQRGFEATTFRLNVAAEPVVVRDTPGPKIGLAPWAENRPSPRPETGPALGRFSALQETVEQETDSDDDLMAQPRARSSSKQRGAAAGEGNAPHSQDRRKEVVSPASSAVITLPQSEAQLLPPSQSGSTNDHRAVTGQPHPQIKASIAGDARMVSPPPALVEAISALSAELGDDAPPGSSLAIAHALLQTSDLPLAAFLGLLTEAAERTQAHRATITRRRQGGQGSNAMPYLIAVLRRLLELSDEPPRPSRTGRSKPRQGTKATRKESQGTDRYTSGSYGVCSQCLCSPCDPDCHTREDGIE